MNNAIRDSFFKKLQKTVSEKFPNSEGEVFWVTQHPEKKNIFFVDRDWLHKEKCFLPNTWSSQRAAFDCRESDVSLVERIKFRCFDPYLMGRYQ